MDEVFRFKNFEIKDKEYLKTLFINKNNFYLCEFNFLNMFSWGDIYRITWDNYKNGVLIYNDLEKYIYFPLADDINPKDILDISNNMISLNKSGNFMFIPESFYCENKSFLNKYFKSVEDINNYDYIYKSEKLASLSGRKLSKKRNLISQFNRNNKDVIIREITKKDSEICLELSQKWCKERICDLLGFEYEMSAIKRVFDNFDELEAGGVGVFIKNRLCAFSIFSKLNNDCYDIHFEKFITSIKGLAQVINQETAKLIQDRCIYINREQDMGLAGLRKNKRSYKPSFMAKSYRLYRK